MEQSMQDIVQCLEMLALIIGPWIRVWAFGFRAYGVDLRVWATG